MDDHSVDALSALLESLEIGFLALPKIRYSGFVTRIGSGSVLDDLPQGSSPARGNHL